MKLGVLGGTFDPIHEGHLALARAARQQFALDKILFIPTRLPPHKAERTDLAPESHRARMVELAIRGNPDFEMSRLELDRPGVSYTIDTLQDLEKRYPGAGLYLILGADTLETLDTWRDADKIRKIAGLLVAKRPGSDVRGCGDEGVCWISMQENPASSSRVREELRRSHLAPGMLPAAVLDYIQEKKLYAGRA
ncbi:MAG TPA: nicotinate-nucleotide adenylyltransferase [Verrucomicrobiae bacterium]|jgi:nicotinate-nucleotide adenylyltransferase|nr:nicotinate-nucleotide adenylyltransferase [Verrucomicrobiae bacterium]